MQHGNNALNNLLNIKLTNLKLDIIKYVPTKIHTNIIILFISLFLFIKNSSFLIYYIISIVKKIV